MRRLGSDTSCHARQGTPLACIYKAEQDVLANAAARYNPGALHVQMRLGETFGRAAVRALSLCSRDIHHEYFAQFTSGSVAVKVVGMRIHCFPPVGPKRSVMILSGRLPQALRKPAALSTNGVGPQT
jgi:hypothetical protein